ncbi:unnamed protein product [Thlaspi arvense]|uniref:SAP domain-containing protein n=1 Tax=Thlaspi arvense TaxID=13288 RepID=A0AAU9RHG3_THLAR|nr:unnamed protein product [Thlaspi arvense]
MQDEIITSGGQVHSDVNAATPRANDDQIKKATALIRRIELKDFSVCQFANPGSYDVMEKVEVYIDCDVTSRLTSMDLFSRSSPNSFLKEFRHYAVLQALALDEDEMPEIEDETIPDEKGLARPGVINALEEFKHSVYGDSYDEERELQNNNKLSEASRKRKAIAEHAVEESAKYDWAELADSGQLKDLTVAELKYYLAANNLPVTGKKEALVTRILTHLGK